MDMIHSLADAYVAREVELVKSWRIPHHRSGSSSVGFFFSLEFSPRVSHFLHLPQRERERLLASPKVTNVCALKCTRRDFYCSEFYKWMQQEAREREPERKELKRKSLCFAAALEKLKITYSPCQINQNIFRKYIIKEEPTELNWLERCSSAARRPGGVFGWRGESNKSSTMCSEIISHPAKISHIRDEYELFSFIIYFSRK